MPHARILGTGSFVPDEVVRNADLRDRFGIDTSDDWIVQRTGVRERRYAPAGVGTADLALPAARQAIEAAGITTGDLDLIIFATLSPDRAFPGSGVLLQAALGLPDDGRFVPALDVRNQCSGFLYGLSVADAMIRAGQARYVLLVGAEVQSAGLDLTTRGRAVSSLFGDGAGAVVLGPGDATRGVRRVLLGADGRHAEVLSQDVWDMRERPFIAVGADGAGRIEPDRLYARMNGQVVFKHAVARMEEVVRALLDEEGVGVGEVDLYLFHQANLRINQLVAAHLGIPDDKLLTNLDRYGNTTAATIPLLLDEAARAGRLVPGARVVLCAFGSGFTWGAALLQC